MEETLALSLEPGRLVDAIYAETVTVGDSAVALTLKKAG